LATALCLQAAKRRAVAELIFFAGTNDVWRCKQLAGTWNINVSKQQSQAQVLPKTLLLAMQPE
jgi:hypothetical protein